MTEAARAKGVPAGRPVSARIYWVSVLLFAALFAFLTYAFMAEQAPPSRPVVQVRKVIKRRVITTIVPTPGQTSVSAGPVSSSGYTAGSEPVTTSAS
ncbi:MAG TPA: hypothetical protein VFP21_08005 [Solirubrobacterales bacterium]|nr:hypothetical protein [Solirubrobacterales bacterium]